MRHGWLSRVVLVGLLGASLWTLWPLLDALLFGVFMAYLMLYIDDALRNQVSYVVRGSIITGSIVFFVAGFIYGLFSSISTIGSNISGFIEALSGSASFLTEVFELPEAVAGTIDAVFTDLGSSIQSWLVDRLRRFPTALIDLFVFGVTVVYFYVHGREIEQMMFNAVSVVEGENARVLRDIVRSLYDLVTGVFLVRALMALSMFIVASIGFFVLQMEFWWGWAVLVALLEFLPLVGPAFIYVPIGLIYITLDLFWQGVLIILFGIVMIDTIPEVLLRHRIVVPRAEEHSLLLFFGFIAGPMLFGLKGVFLGPAVLVITRDLLYTVENELTV